MKLCLRCVEKQRRMTQFWEENNVFASMVVESEKKVPVIVKSRLMRLATSCT